MFTFGKISFYVIIFVIASNLISNASADPINSDNLDNIWDISHTELSKIIGKDRLRTHRKLMGRKANVKNMNIDSSDKTNDRTDGLFQMHRIIMNWTDSSMKLYNNETDIAFTVDKTLDTITALKLCERSLRTNGISKQSIGFTKDICSAIYSLYCGIHCNRQ